MGKKMRSGLVAAACWAASTTIASADPVDFSTPATESPCSFALTSEQARCYDDNIAGMTNEAACAACSSAASSAATPVPAPAPSAPARRSTPSSAPSTTAGTPRAQRAAASAKPAEASDPAFAPHGFQPRFSVVVPAPTPAQEQELDAKMYRYVKQNGPADDALPESQGGMSDFGWCNRHGSLNMLVRYGATVGDGGPRDIAPVMLAQCRENAAGLRFNQDHHSVCAIYHLMSGDHCAWDSAARQWAFEEINGTDRLTPEQSTIHAAWGDMKDHLSTALFHRKSAQAGTAYADALDARIVHLNALLQIVTGDDKQKALAVAGAWLSNPHPGGTWPLSQGD